MQQSTDSPTGSSAESTVTSASPGSRQLSLEEMREIHISRIRAQPILHTWDVLEALIKGRERTEMECRNEK
jgi:hypothetical protein